MCPKESAHLTFEFSDHFIISPSGAIENKKNFDKNFIGEKGKAVSKDFEYSSDKNQHFLSVTDIIKLNKS